MNPRNLSEVTSNDISRDSSLANVDEVYHIPFLIVQVIDPLSQFND